METVSAEQQTIEEPQPEPGREAKQTELQTIEEHPPEPEHEDTQAEEAGKPLAVICPRAVHHPDAMREVRAMIVAALPLPPLPIMVSRELAGEEGAFAASCCSSHDLLAHLMNIACTCATEKQNSERAALQIRLQADLFDAVDSWREAEPDPLLVLPPIGWTYKTLCDFTRKYVQSYLPDPARDQDLRFLPLHEVDREHPVHARAIEFHKAQDLLYGKCRLLTVARRGERYARSYDTLSYAELVQMSVARILDSK